MSQYDPSSYILPYYTPEQQLCPLPQPSSSKSYTSSPEDGAQSGDKSRRESPIHDIVGYMADLPSLSEVKAACDCYADECGELGTVSPVRSRIILVSFS